MIKILYDFCMGVVNGLGEIWAHKVRSMLSMIGIVLGVSALVAMISIVENLLGNFKRGFEDSGGVETVEISPQEPPAYQSEIAGLSKGLRIEDCQAIRDAVPLVSEITPMLFATYEHFRNGNNRFGAIGWGVTMDYLIINKFTMHVGRGFGDLDYENCSLVAIIGHDVAMALFDSPEDALGKPIKIRGVPFTVVGVLDYYEFMQGGRNAFERKNRTLFIPAMTCAKRFKGDTLVHRMFVKVNGSENVTSAVAQIENTLKQTHNQIEDYQITTREEALASFKKTESQFMYSLGGIAMISLLVGGIGIMNVMLAVINERIREIGVRKAVGARGSDIFIQFLAESAVISALGGLIGMAASILLVKILSHTVPGSEGMAVPMHAMIKGLSFSIIIGVLSGIYPSLRAAKLDPIEALRYE